MSRLRILHLGKYYPPVKGGIETVVETLCRGEAAWADSSALVINDGPRTVVERRDGVEVTRVGSLARVGAVSLAPALPVWLARADEPAYSTSKAGLLMLTRSLARAHAEDRIRVNAVCPGPVGNTGVMDRTLAQSPDPAATLAASLRTAPLAAAWGRVIDAGEVAALIRYLCSDAAVMITGATITIDGGKSLAGPA